MSDKSRRTFLKVSGSVLGGIALGSTVTAATATDRFIVDSEKLSQSAVSDADLTVVHDLEPVDLLVVEGDESAVSSLTNKYAPDTTYSLGLPAGRVESSSATDEPDYDLQWDKQSQNIPEAHEVTRGEGSRVAVLDTGVDPDHPDLKHAVNDDLSRNMTGDGGDYRDIDYHGTHVSGIIAANDRNETGIVGSAPATDLVALRVFPEDDGASFADVLAGVVYSVEVGCDVANMSLGAYPVERKGNGKFYGKKLNKVTTYANSNGTLLVASAGNDDADLQHDGSVISLPNEGAQVMSISATGPVGFNHGDDGLDSPVESPANYTNYGTNAVNIAAPGGDYDQSFPTGWFYDMVYSTTPSGYSWVAGTSMAAPQVAGAAALVASQSPDLGPNGIRRRLENTATVPDGFDKSYYGAGLLDTAAAVRE